MPVNNGKIYRDTSTTPPKGVSLDDIAKGIGLASRDLGTLCQGMKDYEDGHAEGVSTNPTYAEGNAYEGQINCWSKAKPVFFTGSQSFLGPDATAAQIMARQQGNGEGYRTDAYTGRPFKMAYGMEIPSGEALFNEAITTGTGSVLADGLPTSVDGLPSTGFLAGLVLDGERVINTRVTTLRWRYEPPLKDQGTSFIPFRILDFDGYDGNAVSPLPFVQSGLEFGVYQDGGTWKVIADAILPGGLPESRKVGNVVVGGNITFDELCTCIALRDTDFNPKNMYLCGVLYHTDEVDGHVDYMLWGSAAGRHSDNLGNWLRIYIELPTGSNADTVAGITAMKGWKLKTFFCSQRLLLSDIPQGTTLCVRGSEATATGLKLVRRNSTLPTVQLRLAWMRKHGVDGANGQTRWSLAVAFYNYSGAAMTLDEVWVQAYDSATGRAISSEAQYDWSGMTLNAVGHRLVEVCDKTTLGVTGDVDFIVYACEYGSDTEVAVLATAGGFVVEASGESEIAALIESRGYSLDSHDWQ